MRRSQVTAPYPRRPAALLAALDELGPRFGRDEQAAITVADRAQLAPLDQLEDRAGAEPAARRKLADLEGEPLVDRGKTEHQQHERGLRADQVADCERGRANDERQCGDEEVHRRV